MNKKKCPYHEVEPECSETVFREEFSKEYVTADNKRSVYVFPRLAEYRWYCPECEVASRAVPKERKYAKLAKGVVSNKSAENALERWNKTVAGLVLRILKKAAEGKDA